MTSIIVPAHNEECVITRFVKAITTAAREGELDLIVVCNGCTDRTVEITRSLGQTVRVIETPIASKSNALNLGDGAATGFPRFYIDADVVLEPGAIEKISAVLEQPGILAASPGVRHDFSDASWSVRAFYAIDRRLPSSREAIGGSGVYALSEQGRRRFEKFPNIVADDAYVRRQFSLKERVVVREAISIVTPPRRLAGLIKIKARSHYGNYELAEKFPQLNANKGAGNRAALIRLAMNPFLWPRLVVYGWVKIVAKMPRQASLEVAVAIYLGTRRFFTPAGASDTHAMIRDEPRSFGLLA